MGDSARHFTIGIVESVSFLLGHDTLEKGLIYLVNSKQT